MYHQSTDNLHEDDTEANGISLISLQKYSTIEAN